MNEAPTMLSIRETARRSGLSENAVRRLVRESAVPFIRVGKKVLLNWEMLVNFLNRGENSSQN